MYLMLSIFCLSAPGSVVIASGQVRMTDVKVLERGDDWLCPSMEERERARNEIHEIASSVIAFICNGTPGWRRVTFINMTDTSYNCPTGLNLTSYSKRTCGRSHTTAGCSSTIFSVGGLPYSRVCGRIRGYQFGATDGFFYYNHGTNNPGIDSYYVEGVSLTHGGAGNRQHIWTFAVGLSEMTSSVTQVCPCDKYVPVPSFVGNDYFCESGLNSKWNAGLILYADDVLWDGQNCTSTSTCCQFNNPPWFTKNLPNATNDDIEFRICTGGPPIFDDVPIELIELYVQ